MSPDDPPLGPILGETDATQLRARIARRETALPGDKFRLETDRLDDGSVLLTLGGYLDSYSFMDLEREFERLAGDGVHTIAVDLKALEYVSSSGIGVFVSAAAHAREKGGSFALMNPNNAVRDVFDVLGLI